MQRHGELGRAEAGREMPAALADRVQQKRAEFLDQRLKPGFRQFPEIRRAMDFIQQGGVDLVIHRGAG